MPRDRRGHLFARRALAHVLIIVPVALMKIVMGLPIFRTPVAVVADNVLLAFVAIQLMEDIARPAVIPTV